MFQAPLCPSSGEQDRALPIWCSALVVLAVVVWKWVASCVHYVKVTVQLSRTVTFSSTQPQPAQPVQTTICGSTRFWSPDDGKMVGESCWDRSLIINIRLVASCWFLSLHTTFMKHGHKSPKFSLPYLPQISLCNIDSYNNESSLLQ